MRLLHTADVHLRSDEPRTIDALETLLETASDHGVDLLTVGGDFFHSAADASSLRPSLRSLLRDNPFEVLVVPGNHDATVYERDLFFGNDVDVLVDRPIAERRTAGAHVVGIPYSSELTEDIVAELSTDAGAESPRILLLHCTLDVGFGRGAVGADEPNQYFPVRRETLSTLDFEYVLAGHIHSKTRQIPLSNGGIFVYPGSPVSHSQTERGRRHAVLIDTDRDVRRAIPLSTEYYDRLSISVRPGAESGALDTIEDWVADREGDSATLEVVVDGYTEWEETEFESSLEAVTGGASVTNETRGVSHVLDHPLYRQFHETMDPETMDDPEGVRTRVIEVLSALLAKREIRS